MTVKMDIPNKGRLNERSIELITKAGINLGDDWGRKLNIKVPDLDLEVFFVRAQDIPIFIDSGAVDFGITGQDVTAEAGKELKNVLNLRFGQCRLSIAAPEESAIARTGKMEDGIRVATSFPYLTRKYFEDRGISAEIVFVQGAAEIMPQLGVSDAISDLVATGSTLRMNRLKEIDTVIESDMELLLPAWHVPQESERIHLYRELDDIERDQDIDAFAARLVDRFGKIPEPTQQLLLVPRLRRLARKLGIEKVVMRERRMYLYFVDESNKAYYQSPMFGRLLHYLSLNPRRVKIRQGDTGRRSFQVLNIPTVPDALNVLQTALTLPPI